MMTGDTAYIPVRQPADGNVLDVDTRNMLLRALCCLSERAFALIAQRRGALRHITASPSKIDDFARAALVLAHFAYGRLI
jgi:hypothetical protein